MRVVGKMTIRKLVAYLKRRGDAESRRREAIRSIIRVASKNKTLDWMERIK